MNKLMLALLCLAFGSAHAESISIAMNLVNATGVGKTIGTIEARDSAYGLIITPDLSGLTPGIHGFHVHQHPDCGTAMKDGKPVPGLAAGGHYDPGHAGHHSGPYADGHLGDLPALTVDAEGRATLPILAPRLKVADIKGTTDLFPRGRDAALRDEIRGVRRSEWLFHSQAAQQ